MLNKLCVLTIQVSSLEESINFYTEALGFKVSKRYGENIVSLEHGEMPIVLEQTKEVFLTPQQNVLLGILSKDLDNDIALLREKGVKTLFDEHKPCPPGRYNVIEDPTGNRIELVEFSNS